MTKLFIIYPDNAISFCLIICTQLFYLLFKYFSFILYYIFLYFHISVQISSIKLTQYNMNKIKRQVLSRTNGTIAHYFGPENDLNSWQRCKWVQLSFVRYITEPWIHTETQYNFVHSLSFEFRANESIIINHCSMTIKQ